MKLENIFIHYHYDVSFIKITLIPKNTINQEIQSGILYE
jgi:hypothetical protein